MPRTSNVCWEDGLELHVILEITLIGGIDLLYLLQCSCLPIPLFLMSFRSRSAQRFSKKHLQISTEPVFIFLYSHWRQRISVRNRLARDKIIRPNFVYILWWLAQGVDFTCLLRTLYSYTVLWLLVAAVFLIEQFSLRGGLQTRVGRYEANLAPNSTTLSSNLLLSWLLSWFYRRKQLAEKWPLVRVERVFGASLSVNAKRFLG